VRFTIYTLFANLIEPYLQEALLGKALRNGHLSVELRDLRRFAGNRTNRVDDAPYGGGAGMVMRVDVAAKAIDELQADSPQPNETTCSRQQASFEQDSLSTSYLAAHRHHLPLRGLDARVEDLVTRQVRLAITSHGGSCPPSCC